MPQMYPGYCVATSVVVPPLLAYGQVVVQQQHLRFALCGLRGFTALQERIVSTFYVCSACHLL